MILAVITTIEEDGCVGENDLYCDQNSFELAGELSKVLAEHMTLVYRLLPKVSEQVKRFSSESERKLYEELPRRFLFNEFCEKATSLNLNSRTVERYLTAWKKEGLIVRLRQGEYEKRKHQSV